MIIFKKYVVSFLINLSAVIFFTGCASGGNETDNSTKDTTGPAIKNVMASYITNNSAIITWTTNESSNSNIKYGSDDTYGSSISNEAFLTSHILFLSGLEAGITYHFRVNSSDESGNNAASEDLFFSTTDVVVCNSMYYQQWENSLPSDSAFFPLAVWLQSPGNADEFLSIGINTYIGLWQGPTEDQLTNLRDKGIYVIAAQNETGLSSENNGIIKAWMHQDEPDNAQWNSETNSWGACIAPAVLVDLYNGWKINDPTRPVLLNFGQGVSNIGWYGRWYLNDIGGNDYSGDNYSLYYTEASEGADILSYDIYPVADTDSNIHGKLEYVPTGVKNLIEWSGGKKPVWNCIETTHIGNENNRPTGDQIRSEVWMSIISGSMGIIYFVHEWYPEFREDGIFNYADAVAAVTEINSQITELAPVLNSQSATGSVQAASSNTQIPVDIMVKNYNGDIYIFSSVMQNSSVTAEFTVTGISAAAVDVLGEDRQITMTNGKFQDSFIGYGVHLYQIVTQ